MSDWLHNLPVAWMTLVIFGATYAGAGAILIASHNRPFTGEISVGPDVLLQVTPDERVPQPAP